MKAKLLALLFCGCFMFAFGCADDAPVDPDQGGNGGDAGPDATSALVKSVQYRA